MSHKTLDEMLKLLKDNASVNSLVEKSAICHKIIDTDFNLRFMSKKGGDDLRIENIEKYYGTSFPFKSSPKETIDLITETLHLATRGQTNTIEYHFNVEGNDVWYNTTITPYFDDNDTLMYISADSLNITKLKIMEIKLAESANLFTTVFDQSPSVIEIYSTTGKLLDVNKAWEKLWNLDKNDIAHFNVFEDKEAIRTGIAKGVKDAFQDKVVTVPEILYDAEESEFPGGNELWISPICYPIKNQENEIINVIVTYNDDSLKKKAHAAVIESQRLSAMGEISSGVAHDFNNSLQSIFGNLELALLNEGIPEPVRVYLEAIKTAASDSAARVQSLQRFGGKKHAKTEYASSNINTLISDVIQQSRPLWKDQAEKKGITIYIITKYGDVPNVLGDDGELRSVVYNIVKNSIEAMPNGGECVFETEKKKEVACIRITDSGVGMDKETATKVFQPLYSTKGFEPGRGFGMASAYTIIQEHKGEIHIKKTAPGEGTSIEITLPYFQEGDKDIENAPLEYDGSARVLWVDDDAMIRGVAEQQIETLGHIGDVASSGLEALECLAKNDYDLVITDIGMPEMSGWQLANRIKEIYQGDMKVAIVTGWGLEVTEQEKKAHGVGYVIGKPIRLVQLKNLIAEAMQMKDKQF